MSFPMDFPAYPTTPITEDSSGSAPLAAAQHQLALSMWASQHNAAVNTLDGLVAFYQQERSWVSQSRASLELALVQGPLVNNNQPGNTSEYTASTDASNQSHQTLDSNDMPIVPHMPTPNSSGVPLSAVRARRLRNNANNNSRWNQRKKNYNLNLGPLTQARPHRRRTRSEGPEPGAQLLHLFGDLLDSRMESCIRISRLVRESARQQQSMLQPW